MNYPLARNLAAAGRPVTAMQEEPLPILEYLQLLWYRKWTIIAITLLVGIAGWVWVNQQTPVYRAQSTIMLGSPMGITSPEMMCVAYFNQLKAPDEIEVLKSRSLAEQLVKSLNLLSLPRIQPFPAGGRTRLAGLTSIPATGSRTAGRRPRKQPWTASHRKRDRTAPSRRTWNNAA